MTELTRISKEHLDHLYRKHMTVGFLQERRQEIESNVREMGANSYDILLPETHLLPVILHPDEYIQGIVYGRYKQDNGELIGRGAMVATDRRIILIDKKPLFLKCEEMEYGVVTGVTHSRVGFMGIVTLHSRMGDTRIRTFNQHCADGFVEAIEARIFEAGKRTLKI